ncbi:MAG: helix-turn-helix transcriptional regulator [Collinsella sp.]|nr:helix-turn-helix transcriptional regulator [Collinsella sp.]
MNVGESIAAYRREAGMSQAELARAVLVSRQTVSNWETQKTLPDIESLKRLAATFQVSVDELLGESAPRIREETAGPRQAIFDALAKAAIADAFWMLLQLADVVIQTLELDGTVVLGGDSAWRIILLLGLAAAFFSMKYAFRIRRIMSDESLENAVQVVAFLEGRDPAGSLPRTFVYRWVIPHWSVWLGAFYLLLMTTVLLPLSLR